MMATNSIFGGKLKRTLGTSCCSAWREGDELKKLPGDDEAEEGEESDVGDISADWSDAAAESWGNANGDCAPNIAKASIKCIPVRSLSRGL